MPSKLDFLFNPKQIAVIGASRSPQKIGYAILRNIIDSKYRGAIYPINPKEEEIAGLKVYPTIKETGKPVDLAIISVPEEKTIEVARECGEAGVKGMVVITAGFKEVGSEGLKRERELVQICRRYGMRMLGPNCVGLMDTHTPLNASFARGFPSPGNISFISQSGAMVLSILDWSLNHGIGFSRFISLGNKADLNEIDFIAGCASDPNTEVILCYIEDITDGDRFIKVCSETAARKPVIILKAGTSAAGAKAASSHTGALAGTDRAYETAFHQSGVLRARNMDELFDMAIAFATQPLPGGDRVAIVTNAGGPGILAADAVEKFGLKMAQFEKETIDKLRKHLPPEANFYNPLDILGDAREERYSLALESALQDKNVDSVLVLLCPTAVMEPENTARTILAQKAKYKKKPLFAVFMGGKSLKSGKAILTEGGVPNYTFPEVAVKALRGMVQYSRFRQISKITPVKISGIDQNVVKAAFYDALKDRRLVLLGHETSRIASAYGIPNSPIVLASSAEEAAEASDKLGYPVVLKISSPRILHKTDVGGVALGLQDARSVKEAFEQIMERVHRMMPEAPVYGVEVQSMVEEGTEVIIGMSRDLQFGPLVAFGMGGIYVNLLEDVSFRLASALTSRENILEMLAETKAYTLLKGYRGKEPADLDSLINTIARVARLCLDFEEITELDINPLRVYPSGVKALDIKITINNLALSGS